jgi:hypothetical protein
MRRRLKPWPCLCRGVGHSRGREGRTTRSCRGSRYSSAAVRWPLILSNRRQWLPKQLHPRVEDVLQHRCHSAHVTVFARDHALLGAAPLAFAPPGDAITCRDRRHRVGVRHRRGGPTAMATAFFCPKAKSVVKVKNRALRAKGDQKGVAAWKRLSTSARAQRAGPDRQGGWATQVAESVGAKWRSGVVIGIQDSTRR